MPPFSPVNLKVDNTTTMNLNLNLNNNNNGMDDISSSNDSRDVPFKPLLLELSSTSSFATLPTTMEGSSSTSSLSSFASSASSSLKHSSSSNKMKRNVSFHHEADVVHTVETVKHPQDVYDRWYSKRELHIIRHKIRSLLKWVNMRNEHFFHYEHQSQVEYYDDDSQEQYLRTVPPPPPPPCNTFYNECLFGLEKHLFVEKEQVRETKYHAQSAVFYEQQLQKEMGHVDPNRLAYTYSQTSLASQQEAIAIAQINAQESELYSQELQAQLLLEQEQRARALQLQQQRELELRQLESLETSFLEHPHESQHLFLLEPQRKTSNPLNLFQNWKACFGKLFRPHECEIDSEDDCLNAPPRQPQRHPCLNIPPEEEQDEEEVDFYHR